MAAECIAPANPRRWSAVTQAIGGFVQAITGDISEVVGFIKSGDVRVLAVLIEERLPGEFSNIPTAREQGVDVVAGNWRGLYVPKGISDAEYARWSNALQAVADSDEWAASMEANGLTAFNFVGDGFQIYISNLMLAVAGCILGTITVRFRGWGPAMAWLFSSPSPLVWNWIQQSRCPMAVLFQPAHL